MAPRAHVEILYFDGCPNHQTARALVERLAAEFKDYAKPSSAVLVTRLRTALT